MAKNEGTPSVSLGVENQTTEASVPKPPDAKEQLVRVHVVKDVQNTFIGGNRYTFKKGEDVSIPVEIAYHLKQDGSVI